MGYFNFYIFKKIFRKYKKLFFILSIFLLIIFLKNKVFASFSITHNNITYNLPDLPLSSSQLSNYDGYFLFTDGNNYVKLVYCPKQTRVYYRSSDGNIVIKTSALSNGSSILAYESRNYNSVWLNWSTWSISKDNSGTSFGSFNSNNTATRHIIYSTLDVYNGSSGNSLYYEKDITDTAPYIINTDRISTWSFSTLNISGGTEFQATMPERTDFTLFIYYANYYFSLDIKPYMNYEDVYNHVIFYVPRQMLLTNYNIVGDESLRFELETVYHDPHTNGVIKDLYDLGTFQLNIDSATANSINNNADKQLLTNIDTSINEQTEEIQNIENTITDTTVNTTSSDLPSTDVSNPAEEPLNNIFMIIYNAFCTGEPQDIVFPIPFTNKNITLSPYYVRDMLNNNGGSWVVSFADMFWQFVIAFFIIKDVSKKVNKIKAGDIENIENTNIKEDML